MACFESGFKGVVACTCRFIDFSFEDNELDEFRMWEGGDGDGGFGFAFFGGALYLFFRMSA